MEKNFKVVFIPQAGGDFNGFKREYETMDKATAVLNAIADYTLLLHECSLMPDYSNIGMLYKRSADGWIEIDDDGVEI